ncbi:hypothetical protein ACWD6R_18050 [Streptomyces sp. NPDC005151]
MRQAAVPTRAAGSEGVGMAGGCAVRHQDGRFGRRLNAARRTTPVADRSAVVTGAVGRSGGAAR